MGEERFVAIEEEGRASKPPRTPIPSLTEPRVPAPARARRGRAYDGRAPPEREVPRVDLILREDPAVHGGALAGGRVEGDGLVLGHDQDGAKVAEGVPTRGKWSGIYLHLKIRRF